MLDILLISVRKKIIVKIQITNTYYYNFKNIYNMELKQKLYNTNKIIYTQTQITYPNYNNLRL